MQRQRTLRNSIRATGMGLRSRNRTDLLLRPAPPDTGVVFRRIDLGEPVAIPAHIEYADSSLLSLSLRRGSVAVSGVERLLAAATALGIDNMYVDIHGPEVPVLDGSASPFVFLIQSAGAICQDTPRRFIRILRTIEVADGPDWARLEPHHGLRIVLEHRTQLEVSETAFIKEYSRARSAPHPQTSEDASATAGSLGVNGSRAISGRFVDEHIRGAIVAIVGDLSLPGGRILGAFEASGTNRALRLDLLRLLATEPAACETIPSTNVLEPSGRVARASTAA